MNQVQGFETQQPALLAGFQIGRHLAGDHGLEAAFQHRQLRLDAVAGLELQELQQRVVNCHLDMQPGIAPQRLRDDAAVFILLRLAAEAAQGMERGLLAPQPGIGIARQLAPIGAQLPGRVAAGRAGIFHQLLHDAVLHQPGENKDRAGAAEEDRSGHGEIAHHDQRNRHRQRQAALAQVGHRQQRPPAPRQPHRDGADQKSTDQTQMRRMTRHRQAGDAHYAAPSQWRQALASEQQQPAAQDHQRCEYVGLHLAGIPADAGHQGQNGADDAEAGQSQPRHFGTCRLQDQVAGESRLQDDDRPHAVGAAGQEQQLGVNRRPFHQEDMAQSFQHIGAGIVEDQRKAVPDGHAQEHRSQNRHAGGAGPKARHRQSRQFPHPGR